MGDFLTSSKDIFMIMKNYVTDELVNKIYHLTKAIDQAKEIIAKLEKENKELKELLVSTAV
jgi:hypothetical protein